MGPIQLTEEDAKKKWVPNWVHTTLDIAGLVPVIGEAFDLINAGLYAAQGDYLNAGLSAASAIPIAGYGASGTKLGMKGIDAVKAIDKTRDAEKLLSGSNGARKLLPSPRHSLLSRAENKKLRNIINDLYRRKAKVGSGSSMDAYRMERKTGLPVGKKFHTEKMYIYRKGLLNLWRKKGQLSVADRKIVKDLLKDIQDALSNY